MSILVASSSILIIVGSAFRRSGGGEIAWGDALLLAAPSAILAVRASEDVLKNSTGDLNAQWLTRSAFEVSCRWIRVSAVGRAETRGVITKSHVPEHLHWTFYSVQKDVLYGKEDENIQLVQSL